MKTWLLGLLLSLELSGAAKPAAFPDLELGFIRDGRVARATLARAGPRRRLTHWIAGERREQVSLSERNFQFLMHAAKKLGTTDRIQARRRCARSLLYLRWLDEGGAVHRFSACSGDDTALARELRAMLDRIALLL